jgi:GT2 family glycosyltransferase
LKSQVDVTKSFADRLTLSIVSHGHGEMVRQLLDDIAAHSTLAGTRVVLTLNVPEPGLLADRWPQLDLDVQVNAKPQGFGANHNRAFVNCSTPFFAVLNPDLRLPQDPFPGLLACIDSNCQLALVAPRIVDPQGTPEDSVRENLSLSSLLRRYLGSADKVQSEQRARSRGFFWVAGMFMLVRCRDFAAVGGFDERFHLYCEDYDLCARLVLSGRRIGVADEVFAIHDARRDSRRTGRHLRWHLSS